MARKLDEQKAAGPLTPDMENVERCLRRINGYHAMKCPAEGRGGAVYGSPTVFADVFQYSDPQELQMLTASLVPLVTASQVVNMQ